MKREEKEKEENRRQRKKEIKGLTEKRKKR
jgi:hypothetical protein